MCGIAGVSSNQLKKTDVAQRVLAMQNALRHRGPDDHGIYSSPRHATTVAHTRLSIIDLSSKGHQPMLSPDGRYTITYNGEIYNYQSLKKNLEAAGEKFVSQSDTEVILKLYRLEGEQCLKKLRGMFAFFIWDDQKQQGFAARDPLGIKPFYYWHNENSFAFASELRALRASGLVSNQLSSKGLTSYFFSGSVSEPHTILNDARLLAAGHTLRWNSVGELDIQSYAQINFQPEAMDIDKALRITRTALEDSVKAHFVSDVPVGVFLSGGIDSTALLALSKSVTNNTIRTYSIAFEDPKWNEGDIARRVAEHFGCLHTELVMTPEIARTQFNEFLKTIDQPTIDGFNTYCVAKLAHDHGEKVVISGLGGDELFAGYKSFVLLPRMVSLSRKLRVLSPLFRFCSTYLDRFCSPTMRRALDFMSDSGSLSAAHQSLRGIFSKTETHTLLRQCDLDSPHKFKQAVTEPQSLPDAISKMELTTYMRNQLLRDSDVMSMAWGLELRVPLVDYHLIQTLSTIPASLRLRLAKKLLIESVPEIPEWVVNRPKQGFRFPFDHWFNESWGDLQESEIVPKGISLSAWYRRWNLLVLAYWKKHYL